MSKEPKMIYIDLETKDPTTFSGYAEIPCEEHEIFGCLEDFDIPTDENTDAFLQYMSTFEDEEEPNYVEVPLVYEIEPKEVERLLIEIYTHLKKEEQKEDYERAMKGVIK